MRRTADELAQLLALGRGRNPAAGRPRRRAKLRVESDDESDESDQSSDQSDSLSSDSSDSSESDDDDDDDSDDESDSFALDDDDDDESGRVGDLHIGTRSVSGSMLAATVLEGDSERAVEAEQWRLARRLAARYRCRRRRRRGVSAHRVCTLAGSALAPLMLVAMTRRLQQLAPLHRRRALRCMSAWSRQIDLRRVDVACVVPVYSHPPSVVH